MTAVYDCVVRHQRTAPLRHGFAYRTSLWLVDLDHLPAGFEARDHAGDPAKSIRANLERFLDGHGITLGGGTVRMLTNPRTLGHVFNPLTVYWCHDPGGRLAAIVAEVHNTYGGRHRYLIDPAEQTAEKAFYVSPFFAVDGRYRMRLPEPDRKRLALSIVLEQGDGRPFVATLTGRARTAGRRSPLATRLVSLRIRIQGIRLYLRGLPIIPRSLQEEAP
ncbi:DUF1365 domain-containing protein [Dactylosporangium siamense]|uniref:DUF1365 domain-containing protein n=1 Tax=Dactylosporangium siamense TaxID=685454 RepID=A0A919PGW1_9ACTN|nr:DUF1365 domain-containing protein [Dactylosporangium siamense]GIG42008.1 DUF1365 domain-containing protein [Dactylosporangium siamense]